MARQGIVLVASAAALLAATAPAALAAGKTQRVTNGVSDIFVRDRKAGTSTRVSRSSAGTQADGESLEPHMSRDGRYVIFWSRATNLVPNINDGSLQTYWRDLATGTTALASVGTDGGPANGTVYGMAVSEGGRYVVIPSDSTNLAAGGGGDRTDVFVRDMQSGTTTLESRGRGGKAPNGASFNAAISADGRWLAFDSDASNLVQGDDNGQTDVFLRDRQAGTTVLVSVPQGGGQGSGLTFSPCGSDDGSLVAFQSQATNRVAGDSNNTDDVFVRDLKAGKTERVSVAGSGAQADQGGVWPSMSGDGSRIAFTSEATNLVPGDTNGRFDIFVRDRAAGTTTRASVRSSGKQGSGSSGSNAWIAMSGNGQVVAFQSDSALVPDDSGRSSDVFVHTLPATP